MYAHKAIESIQSFFKNEDENLFEVDFFDSSLAHLQSCPKYHFEKIENIVTQTLRTNDLFQGEYGQDVRLPYPVCWFDYCKENGERVGLLLTELGASNMFQGSAKTLQMELFIAYPKQDVFITNPLNIHIGDEDEINNIVKHYNQYTEENYHHQKLNEKIIISWSDGGVKSKEEFDVLYTEATQEIKNLNACLLLLSCKNIETIDNQPSEKLNKKRIKKNKTPLCSYKTLQVVLPKSSNAKNRQQIVTQKQNSPRTHLCAGHFKIYTHEKPLFGKHTGRYWWQPHLRGDDKKGFLFLI